MRIDNATQAQIEAASAALAKRAARSGEEETVFLDLGPRAIRVICHSRGLMTHMRRQMGICIRPAMPAWDATFVIWRENDFEGAALAAATALDPSSYPRLRVQRLAGAKIGQVSAYNEDCLRFWPLVDVNPEDGSLGCFNPHTQTYYYAVRNLEPEEFIRRGHMLVQQIFRVCNRAGSSLAHGAVIGLNGIGVLFCAFGYRGKSTLCVSALLDGFEYVSDDYFILGKTAGQPLRAWPIYSIVALSPAAYTAIYDRFDAKFLSMNGRKDKYMFNISAYHDQFRAGYPISVAIFPHICDTPEPSINPGARELALEELCFSTLNNTGNMRDALTIGRLYEFTEALPFFKFELSRNISKNVRCLREFLLNYNREVPV